MAKKKPTTKSKKDNKKKRKILLATLIPVGALVAATAITVPLVLANRNKGNEDDPIAYKKAVVLRNVGNATANITLYRPYDSVTPVPEQYKANFEFSTDGIKWTTPVYVESTEQSGYEEFTYDLGPSKTLFIRGDNDAICKKDDLGTEYHNKISITQGATTWTEENHASVELSGSIMGLLDKAGEKPKSNNWEMPNMCFKGTFEWLYDESKVSTLTTVSKDLLSSEKIVNHLSESCFDGLFLNCMNLTNSPDLPSTKLANSCYTRMFADCTSLSNPPALPANELADSCYYRMFNACSSLKKAPKLPNLSADKYQSACFIEMFQSCSSLKILDAKTAATVEIFTLPTGITVPSDFAYNMFNGTLGGINTPEANKTYYYEEQ